MNRSSSLPMRVLVLGASGYIGQRIVHHLQGSGWASALQASRRPVPAAHSSTGAQRLQLDTLDLGSLSAALAQVDAVVNCVAGSAHAIAEGARLLAAAAAAQATSPRIVHMSSMAVYGAQEGTVTESSPLDPTLGWYAQAKCEAEAHLRQHAQAGHPVVMLRPGCVYGPGSELWVGRIGRLLLNSRLGDLGEAGDGWSNLIHVDDVCAAVLAALHLPCSAGIAPTYNLSAPDSPRWNQYFLDLALAIGATPVKRLRYRRVALDAKLAGPMLKVGEKLMQAAGLATSDLPVPISPSLLKLWPQQIFLDPSASLRGLNLHLTPYGEGLQQSAAWFASTHRTATSRHTSA